MKEVTCLHTQDFLELQETESTWRHSRKANETLGHSERGRKAPLDLLTPLTTQKLNQQLENLI